MKYNKYIIILIGFLFVTFLSCEKDYLDDSRITYFPDFVIEGDEITFHLQGNAYTDGSVTAVEYGSNLPVSVRVTGDMTGYSGTEVDVNTIDKYTITYSATNSDGFDGTVIREVFVSPPTGDLITSIEGVYISSVTRAPDYKVEPNYTNMMCIFIIKTGANTYEITDALGGYYYMGRAYGYDYAARGTVITANDIASNDFNFTTAEIPAFGNKCDITDFVVDAANKQITFTGNCDFSNGTFKIQLDQVQF